MRIPLNSIHTMRATGAKPRTSEDGFAVFVVIVLLAIMVSLAISNNVALGHLHRELRLLDKRHQKRYESEKATNAPHAAAVASTRERAAGLSDSSERPPKE
ncbi:MAG TPA: hypothetical protein VJW76_13175 [Verrucomicrobiae bacterium]|nr:hypothetical protein [Verrucomicrobiae bacterium]